MDKKISFLFFFLILVFVFFGGYFTENTRILLFILIFIVSIFHLKNTFKYIYVSLKKILKDIK